MISYDVFREGLKTLILQDKVVFADLGHYFLMWNNNDYFMEGLSQEQLDEFVHITEMTAKEAMREVQNA